MPDLPPINEDQASMRLDRLLRQKFPNKSLSAIQRALRLRQIRVNNRRIKAPDYRVKQEDLVHVPQYFQDDMPSVPKTLKQDNKIQQHFADMLVAQNAEYFVLNKPAGLAVQGGTGIRWHLDRMLPQLALKFGDETDSLRIVHRLDKETSGLILIARGRRAAEKLSRYFQQHRIEKYYLAICDGVPKIEAGTIDLPLGKGHDHRMTNSATRTQKAITDYALFDRLSNVSSSIMLAPKTGRTHQLRAHMALIGVPISGDPVYGAQDALKTHYQEVPELKLEMQANALSLHAMVLRVPTKDGTAFDEYIAPPPEVLKNLAKSRSILLPNLKDFQKVWYTPAFSKIPPSRK